MGEFSTGQNEKNPLARKPNYENHRYREDLGGEHRWGDFFQVIFMAAFFVVWIYDSFFLHFWPVLSHLVPLYLSIPFGTIILGVAWYYGRIGLHIIFGEIRDPPIVIQEGIFSHCRHPIYLSAIFMFLGFVIMTLSTLSFFVWITILLLYLYLAEGEEKMLIDKFGKEYIKYMENVPKWIPKL